jgi:hypothetical protein
MIHEVTSVQKRAVEFFGQKINFFRGGNMNRPIATAFCLVVLLAGIAEPAAAYVGPGLGAGSIAVVLGIIGSLLLAIVGLVWYPLKRLIKMGKKKLRSKAKHGVTSDSDHLQPPR